MGSGVVKEKNIRPKTIFSKLEDLINNLERSLEELQNTNFMTLEDYNSLAIKGKIESLQTESNEELFRVRNEIKSSRTKEEYDDKSEKLSFLEQKIQSLYIKNSEILKEKINTND